MANFVVARTLLKDIKIITTFISHDECGYLVFEDAIVSCKCTEKFYAEYNNRILWNDRKLEINFLLEKIDQLIISVKDQYLQFLEKYIRKCGDIS